MNTRKCDINFPLKQPDVFWRKFFLFFIFKCVRVTKIVASLINDLKHCQPQYFLSSRAFFLLPVIKSFFMGSTMKLRIEQERIGLILSKD